jgi:hypothetical protein
METLEHEGKCDRCKTYEAEELHPCPFSEEINDDSETLCNCCRECYGDCCMDI